MGEATIAIRAAPEGGCVELQTAGRRIEIPLVLLDGVRQTGAEAVELHRTAGDPLACVFAPGVAPVFLAALMRTACALPELTRSLRTFGAPGTPARSEHDRLFGLLLAARRSAAVSVPGAAEAEAATCAAGQPGAAAGQPAATAGEPGAAANAPRAFHGPLRAPCDAASLRTALEHLLASFAAARWPAGGERRALEVALEDAAAPVVASLGALERAAAALEAGDATVCLARWRAWGAALRDVFDCADRAWPELALLLAAPVPPPTSPWRRWMGRGVRGRG